MAGIATRKRLERQKRERRIRKIAKLADRLGEREADQLETMLDGLDGGWERIRNKIVELAGERGEWAGYPLPDTDHQLVIEPRHPLYATLNGAMLGGRSSESDGGYELVNQWHDYGRGRTVIIVRDAGGRIQGCAIPTYTSTGRMRYITGTLAASRSWSARAEFTAIARLKTLVTPAAFKYYILTGTFIESSKRSGVFYLFRKCRPTLAFSPTVDGSDTRLLCALCLHPIGYYEGTYAGSMVPTDDVIAHLTMMRGDERKFWAKSNQHDCRSPEAGV